MTANDPVAYYRPLGRGRYAPTSHVEGAWTPEHQHMGPVSGLMVHEIERAQPREDLQLSRVSFDILGVLPMREVEVRVRTVRPGRTIELVEAEMYDAAPDGTGRSLVRASAWWLPRSDTTAVAGIEADPMPGRAEGEPWKGSETWQGGFIRSLEFLVVPTWRPGRARVWLRSLVDLVDGEDASALARYFAIIDTANGIAVRQDPRSCFFPNTDLTVHLLRQPERDWLGLDTAVSFGAAGVGLTSSTLHDPVGMVGRAEQILTVRSG